MERNKITIFKRKEDGPKEYFISLSAQEALLLAENLVTQVRTKNSNTNRPEFFLDQEDHTQDDPVITYSHYFSIGVIQEQ